MSLEVVYTSAPRGIVEGTSGFCTVARTQGANRALVKKLESLSGYHHAYAAGSGRNPVNFSHTIIRVQQKPYHVLSRIADAGNDHTGRSNKIAHHLALTPDEVARLRGGPLPLFADSRFWFEEWDREPANLPPGRMPQPSRVGGGDFMAWDEAFGDPGWAGILGGTASGQVKPAGIIIPPGEDAFDLLAEAMELIAPSRRWRIGFSTYLSQAAVEGCHWRFALDGTEAARKLRGRSAAMVIDYKARKALPTGNEFVEAARAGEPERVHRTQQTVARRSARRRPRQPPRARASRSPDSSVHQGGGGSGRQMRPSERRRRQAGGRHRATREEYSDDEWDEEVHELDLDSLEEGKNPSRRLYWILGGILCLGLVGFLSYQFLWPSGGSSSGETSTIEETE